MIHANLVASELNDQGFRTRVISNAVEVSLKNRKVSQMEVKTALRQIFENIEFILQSTSDSVLVVT